jgi:hypothetical protein
VGVSEIITRKETVMSEFYCDNELWNKCKEINALLIEDKYNEARKMLKEIAMYLVENNKKSNPLFNRLLHQAGMYSYIDEDTADWSDVLVKELWKEGHLIEAEV